MGSPATSLSTDLLVRRATAAYLGLALGDALGATVEFMTPREIQVQHGRHDRIRGGGWLNLKPGQVTDDTAMSLALGRAILDQGGVEAGAVARAFDAWMRSKPVDMGNTVRRGILHFRLTGHPEVPPDEHGAGNGAAMRVLPVILATLGQDEAALFHACRIQSHVTHNHPESDAGTEGLALLVRAALTGADKPTLAVLAGQWARDWPWFDPRPSRPRLNPSGYIAETMAAVLQAFFGQEGFHDILVEVVNRGGDADTTGAIAGMLAGAFYGLESLPDAWLGSLDPGVTSACRQQAEALCRLGMAEPDLTPSGAGP